MKSGGGKSPYELAKDSKKLRGILDLFDKDIKKKK